jgi:lysine 2,3-aminomutase
MSETGHGPQRARREGRDAWCEARRGGSWRDWRWQQRHRLNGVEAILEALGPSLGISPACRAGMLASEARFRAATTPYYLSLADVADPRDPILPQVLPDPAETREDGRPDPFDETGLEIAPGVVHRYPDRVLFLLTNYCSTLCRHCMRKREWRRRFQRLTPAQAEAGIRAIRARPEVRDVLLSGGDPLHLPPSFLAGILRGLRDNPRLDCIRFGSRVPVTLPQRIDDELLGALEPFAPLYLNTHFNHSREVTEEAREAVSRLSRAGVVVSNQGVLMRGINDRAEDLLDLSRALLRAGVRAYYLHSCDPVQGARHFRVGLRRARSLIASLRGQVSGLAIPRLIVDLPGGAGKVAADGPELEEIRGDLHFYRSPLHGLPVAVDGSEGSFAGAGSWMIESEEERRYAARPSPTSRAS